MRHLLALLRLLTRPHTQHLTEHDVELAMLARRKRELQAELVEVSERITQLVGITPTGRRLSPGIA